MSNANRRSLAIAQLNETSEGTKIDQLPNLTPQTLQTTPGTVDKYVAKHGGDTHAATHSLRTVVSALMENGHYHKDDDGYHTLFGHGYRVVLTPKADKIVGYTSKWFAPTIFETLNIVPPAAKDYRNTRAVSAAARHPLSREDVETLDGNTIDALKVPSDLLTDIAANKEESFEAIREQVKQAVDDAVELNAFTEGENPDSWVFTHGDWKVVCSKDIKYALQVEFTGEQTPED